MTSLKQKVTAQNTEPFTFQMTFKAKNFMIIIQPLKITAKQFGPSHLIGSLLVSINILFFCSASFAASCCGGGASSGVILPKFNDAMWDVSLDNETYNGYWTKQGAHQDDPAGSELLQRRISFSYAHRIAQQWQVNVSLPLIDNQNKYSGENSSVQGLGDTQVGLWYEAFERVTCVYKITGWESLKPSFYLGSSLTLPTGISAYSDRVDNSFDVTGLGFYRWNTNIIIEKTVYPFSLGWQGSYGVSMKRPINQEYGQSITPYNKQLGERSTSVFSGAYTWFLPNLSMLTATLSHSSLKQAKTKYDGVNDINSGFDKTSSGLGLAYNSSLRDWILKLSINQADRGHNYPKTQTVSMGVSHVYSF
jgi:hypothetical protein